MFLICLSRMTADEREGCSSFQTSSHGPFLRVNFSWFCQSDYVI